MLKIVWLNCLPIENLPLSVGVGHSAYEALQQLKLDKKMKEYPTGI